MINIRYLKDVIEGEPGPNLYWLGACEDYLRLISDLHVLAKDDSVELVLNKISYVLVTDGYSIILRSKKNGRIINQINDKNILIELDRDFWKEILVRFLLISINKGHDYIDFDGKNMSEDANWIISSEGS